MRNENERAKKTHQEGGREKEQLKVCACTRARACVCVSGGGVSTSQGLLIQACLHEHGNPQPAVMREVSRSQAPRSHYSRGN